jgi:hypothetical protein
MVLKYRNVKTVVDGITFDSKREATYYQELLLLKRVGEVTDIELQPKYELLPGYRKCCGQIWLDKPPGGIKGATVCGNCKKKMPKTQPITYSADFKVIYADGRIEIVDVKGMETTAFKDKKKIFEFQNPTLTLKVVNK